MESNKLPIYELIIDEDSDAGIQLVSFVEDPATESTFIYFSEDKSTQYILSSDDNDQHLVTGVVLIPNQRIFRSMDGQNFEVFFSEDTIRRSSELFFKNSTHDTTNINHNNTTIEGVTVVESWIVEDTKLDKSVAIGLGEFPKGTWIATYKVDDINLWDNIKSGDVKGFSIEGMYMKQFTNLSAESEDKDKELDLYNKINEIVNSNDSDVEIYDKINNLLEKVNK